MKKIALLVLGITICIFVSYFLFVPSIFGECPEPLHFSFQKADCNNPEKCFVCGKILNNKLGHIYDSSAKPCASNVRCLRCNSTRDPLVEHTYADNAKPCDENVSCLVCGAKRSPLKEHEWIEATCIKPMYCSVCGKQEGPTKSHQYINCTCIVCGHKTYGGWEVRNYVDSFGDKTNSKYITSYFSGSFSNSATDDSNLTGHWIIDAGSVDIVLEEYGRNRLKGYYSSGVYYDISIKDQNGNIYYLDGVLRKDSDRIELYKSDDRKKMKRILRQGGKLRITVVNIDRRIEKYIFTDDASGFSNIYADTF